MRNTSSAPNAIIYKDELERSTTGIITRAQALQTSSKTNTREYTTAKFKNLATIYRLEMRPIVEIIQTLQTLRYNRSRNSILKIQYFCNFSLVSLSIHTRSRRGAQRIRKGEGRWSRPPKTFTHWSRPQKTFTRWSRPPKTFTCFIRSSPADVKQNKQTLKPCRRQAKQTLEIMPPQSSKH